MQPASAATQALRQDLRLYETAPARDGAPSWAIQDPVLNRFYRIGWLEYECLLRWPGDPAQIAADIASTTPLAVDVAQVEEFARFLEQHQLLMASGAALQRMVQKAREPGWRDWRWWLHHYLFIRVPLVRPERFLVRLARALDPLFSMPALLALLLASLLGMVLVARQWDSFAHSVMDILTPSGITGFLIALVVSKTLHELGHALVATRLGVRVAHMGVALLVMWPMLYTDTGESWRLRSNRQRLAISVAGVGVEMGLAGLATLAWALLDDGSLRQAALYLATTGWVLSVALNVSPFMRFDGYFILSDLLDFPNLHERAGAHAKTWLRRQVLGVDDAYPEHLPPRARRALVVFALVTWCYRAVVFLGIAWAVYAFFFKALGIFLMLVELTWFLAKPVWSELKVWRERWREVRRPRRSGLLALLLLAGGLLLFPWRFDVTAGGVAHAQRQQFVFAPLPTQLAELHPAGRVEAGAVLARFESPDLAAREQLAQASVDALERRLAGLLEISGGREKALATEQRLQEQLAELRAVREEAGRLRITAEFGGQWRDVDWLRRPGAWVGVKVPLGVLTDTDGWLVDAYVGEREVHRIASGAQASFLPEGGLRALNAEVIAVDSTRVRRLAHPMLDSRHGGGFSTLVDDQQGTAPSEALYRVRLRLHEAPPQGKELRGQARIEGGARSLVWDGLRSALAVLVRESGF